MVMVLVMFVIRMMIMTVFLMVLIIVWFSLISGSWILMGMNRVMFVIWTMMGMVFSMVRIVSFSMEVFFSGTWSSVMVRMTIVTGRLTKVMSILILMGSRTVWILIWMGMVWRMMTIMF